jgi:hypothetical protein
VRIRVFVALAVFAYLTILRTWRISEIFGMLGDQVLYWNIALRPWRDLPLGGGPSSVGGTTLGPAFMWTMWGIRLVVGPWTDNLPHAGGIGLSVIQSIADVVLVIAIWRRFESLMLALAVTLLVATTPEEMSLSASIWNPPLSVAFVKIAIALVLLGDRNKTLLAGAAATASAVLAVQCHSSAVFVAAPVIASFPLREWLARRPRRALASAGAAAAVVLFLEIPFLLDLGITGREPTPGAVMGTCHKSCAIRQRCGRLQRFRPLWRLASTSCCSRGRLAGLERSSLSALPSRLIGYVTTSCWPV